MSGLVRGIVVAFVLSTIGQGPTSGTFRGCGNFTVQVSQETITGSWCMELSEIVEAHPLYASLIFPFSSTSSFLF